MLNSMRVSKRRWYDLGGFKNSQCWRRQVGGAWHYYVQSNTAFSQARTERDAQLISLGE